MINTGRDTYMTIWSVTEEQNRIKARASTSRKRKDDNTYVNSNWNFVNFIGSAAEKAKTLQCPARVTIKPGNLRIENIFLPEKDGKPASSLVTVTIFDFEADSKTGSDELPA